MQTAYRILCKYTNSTTGVILSNNPNDTYIPTEEFYTLNHVISVGTEQEKIAAEEQKQDFILKGNDASNVKNSMLFGFSGTKRINQKKWAQKTVGYAIRDFSKIIDKISPAGDYSGEYILVGGDSIKTAIITSKVNPIKTNVTIVSRTPEITDKKIMALTSQVRVGVYTFNVFEPELLNEHIINSTIAKLSTDGDYTKHTTISTAQTGPQNNTIFTYNPKSQILIGDPSLLRYYTDMYTGNGYYTGFGMPSKNTTSCIYNPVVISNSQVEVVDIPAHWEETTAAPYMVKDCYYRIEGDPWFTFARVGSLEDAVQKCIKIVKSVGIENVKLIKEVPFDQKLRVR